MLNRESGSSKSGEGVEGLGQTLEAVREGAMLMCTGAFQVGGKLCRGFVLCEGREEEGQRSNWLPDLKPFNGLPLLLGKLHSL